MGPVPRLAGANPPPSATSVSGAASVRDLSVAELRAAEQELPPPPRLLGPRVTSAQLAAQKRAAELNLPRWIKAHRFLQAVPVEQGEPSVALLLLWEADHGQHYPSQAVELVGRLSTFTKRLKDAVTADSELSAWLLYKQLHLSLTPGVAPSQYLRWAVKIDPNVGEPFLGSWKAHLGSLVRRRLGVVGSAPGAAGFGQGPHRKRLKREVQPRTGVKRPRSGAPPPPLHTKKAPVARLLAAQAAPVAGLGPASGVLFLSSSSSSSPHPGGLTPSGRGAAAPSVPRSGLT